MIPLIAASAMFLAALQAAVAAPTNAYKDCLKQASVEAKKTKVAGDAYEAFARNACTAQIAGLRNALIAFEVKNGTKRKDAATDADLTVDDYLASSVDNYKFLAGVAADNAKAEADARAKAAAPIAPAAQATPASVPNPPK
jgi:high-affinity Fe2+/Pb2+ permease